VSIGSAATAAGLGGTSEPADRPACLSQSQASLLIHARRRLKGRGLGRAAGECRGVSSGHFRERSGLLTRTVQDIGENKGPSYSASRLCIEISIDCELIG